MKCDHFYLSCADEVKIFVNQWFPDEDIPLKAILIVSHGSLSPSKRWKGFAERMSALGFGCYIHDQRGYAQSKLTDGPQIFVGEDGFNKMADDIHLIREWAIKENPGIPVFLLGHSMGNFIARGYAQKYGGIQGLILSGANNLLKHAELVVAVAEAEAKEIGLKARSKRASAMGSIMYLSEFEKRCKPTTRFDFLTSDPAEIEKFLNDPLYGTGFSVGWCLEFNKFIQQVNEQENVEKIPKNLPVLLFTGTMDASADFGNDTRYIAKNMLDAGMNDVTVKLYEGGRHEMFNEINRDAAYADVVRWIEGHI